MGRLRPQRAGLLGGQRPVPVRLPAGPGQAAAAPQRPGDADDACAGVEHRDQLRHQHQLAGVLRRVHPGSPRADGRPVRAELRLRSRRHGRRRRAGPGLRAASHRRSRQLLGRPGARHHSHPAALRVDRCHRSSSPAARSRTSICTTRSSAPWPAVSRPSPVVRSPARKPSRNSAPTAAASTTPTLRTRSRTRPTWTNWVEIFLLLVISFSLPRTFGRMVGQQEAGLRDRRRHGHHRHAQRHPDELLPAPGARHRAHRDRRRHRGHGTTIRRLQLGGVRRRDDADLDGSRRLLPRLLHQPRRHDGAVQHAARRGRAGRHRFRAVRHADPRGHHGLRRRSDGRPHARSTSARRSRRAKSSLRQAISWSRRCWCLVGTAIAMALPGQRAGMLNSGPHGLSEVLYAFTSAANNNGSAFAGISVNTEWYNTALGLAMVLGRFLPMILVLALAGSLAARAPRRSRSGRCPPTGHSSSAWSSASP